MFITKIINNYYYYLATNMEGGGKKHILKQKQSQPNEETHSFLLSCNRHVRGYQSRKGLEKQQQSALTIQRYLILHQFCTFQL